MLSEKYGEVGQRSSNKNRSTSFRNVREADFEIKLQFWFSSDVI